MINPRFTDFHGIHLAQAELDFAIPFLEEDIPLYVDSFLLWKSPSYQDKALHGSILNSFNHLEHLTKKGKHDEALSQLITASECEEVGLGQAADKKGKRISENQARAILEFFERIPLSPALCSYPRISLVLVLRRLPSPSSRSVGMKS